jgi:hypothetical protein
MALQKKPPSFLINTTIGLMFHASTAILSHTFTYFRRKLASWVTSTTSVKYGPFGGPLAYVLFVVELVLYKEITIFRDVHVHPSVYDLQLCFLDVFLHRAGSSAIV